MKRVLFCVWLAACLPIGTRAVEVETIRTEVETIRTEVGHYELLRLPEVGGEFELSSSRSVGVRVDAQSPDGGRQFHSFQPDQPSVQLATVSVNNVDDWRVLQEELFIASEGKLLIYSLPDLKLQRTQQLAPDRPDSASPAPASPPASASPAASPPAIRLELAASINGNQAIVFVNDASSLKGLATPFGIRIGEEVMNVTLVDDDQDKLVVERPMPVPHSVSESIHTVHSFPQQSVRRVPRGWYCDGWVFDDAGVKVTSAFYFRNTRPNANSIADILKRNFRNIPDSSVKAPSTSGTPPPTTMALETIPANLIIPHPDLRTGHIPFRIQGFASKGQESQAADEFTLKPDARIPLNSAVAAPRCNGSDCTFLFGTTGIHLRIVAFDCRMGDLPTPQRFQFTQPQMLSDEQRSDIAFQFCDGSGPHPAKLLPTSSSKGENAIDENVQRFVAERLGGRGASLEEFQKKLESYLTEVNPEFVRLTGRPPKGVPVPHTVTVTTSWSPESAEVCEFTYSVWKEWSRDDLVSLIFQDVIAAAVQQKALADREAELKRLAEGQRQKQEEQERQKRAEESRQLQLRRDAFAHATRLRMQFAVGMCVLGIIACFIVSRRNKPQLELESCPQP